MNTKILLSWQNAAKCIVPSKPLDNKYMDDVIHPCVRYIEQGFAGHYWWMVQTPLYGGASNVEDPILYYGDSQTADAPTTWTPVKLVNETPATGFNSDGNLYFDGDNLWIIFREVETPYATANGYVHVVCAVKYDGTTFLEKIILCGSKSKDYDNVQCPTIIKRQNKLYLYAAHWGYRPARVEKGICIWESDSMDGSFTLIKDVAILHPEGRNYDMWHFDLFEGEGELYMVYTNEWADQICLAKSTDYENFISYGSVLMLKNSDNLYHGGFYKPSVVIVGDTFNLFLTSFSRTDPKLHEMWLLKGIWTTIKDELEKDCSLIE